MIKVFNATDTSFSTNGDKIIQAIKCNIHKEDNGEYSLDLECGLEYIDYIIQNNIIVANTPTGEQAFRINNVEKTRTKLKTKAQHIFYDSKNYLIADSYVVDKNCNDALDHLNTATDNPSPFITTSDINTIDSYRCVRKSLYEAIQVVIERWGGHLTRNNFNVGIMSSIGQDNGVTVRYGKNIKNISVQYNWDNVVTKLMPVGKDGLLLDELYIYSTTQYDIPYTKTVSFDQSNVLEDDYKDESGTLNTEAYTQALKDDLLQQAQAYINIHQYPETNYTLNANLEKITDIGDTIEVIDEVLGVNITTNLISYNYNCILEQYTQLQFGNFTQKLSDLISNINSTVQKEVDEKNSELKITLRDELETATDQIWTALGSSYVIYDGDKILVVDTLPKEEATNVIMINAGGIGFSNTGINGTFTSAWTIDNILNMENINVINLTASLIKGGTLKLGGYNNQSGIIELYNTDGNLIGEMNKTGLKMYGADGSYVLLNNEVGFAGYDFEGNKIYWVDKDEFHQKKSVIEEEITLCNKLRFIPITVYDSSGLNVTGDGIGFVSIYESSGNVPTDRLIAISTKQEAPTQEWWTSAGLPGNVNLYENIYVSVRLHANYDFCSSSYDEPIIYINYNYYVNNSLVQKYTVQGTVYLGFQAEEDDPTNHIYTHDVYAYFNCGAVGTNGKIVVNSIYSTQNGLTTDFCPVDNYIIEEEP